MQGANIATLSVVVAATLTAAPVLADNFPFIGRLHRRRRSEDGADKSGMTGGILALVLAGAVGLTTQFGESPTTIPVLAAAAFAVWLMCTRREVRVSLDIETLQRVFLALVLAHLAYALLRFHHGHVAASGTATINAIQLLMHGANPYTQDMDPVENLGPDFSGYKYLPMMLIAYGPLTSFLGVYGILLTNFIFDTAIAFLIVGLSKRLGATPSAAISGAIVYLAMFFVIGVLYAKGENDAVPVALLLSSWSLEASSPFWAGVCAGLSLSAKLLPAAAALPALLPSNNRGRFCVGFIVGLLPTAVAAIEVPKAFLDNIILFNVLRAPSGLVAEIPNGFVQAGRLGLIAAWLGICAYVTLGRPTLRVRLLIAVISLSAIILAGPILRQNYNLWWAPLICIGAATPRSARPRIVGLPTGDKAVCETP